MIYFDYAATSPMYESVEELMSNILSEHYGNPSSIYPIGLENLYRIEEARRTISALINASPEEIFFTSGGTEGDNWAIQGSANPEKQIITSAFEHPAMLKCALGMTHRRLIGSFKLLPIDCAGQVVLEGLEKSVTNNTSLVSIMLVNNEVGSIQDIETAVSLSKNANENVLFHTDATQAVGHIPIDVKALGVDLLSCSAHKFGGPKGVGFMYIKNGVNLYPLIYGGGQESGLRGGTENVAAICGMARALELSCENMHSTESNIMRLRNGLWSYIKEDDSQINGAWSKRLAGNLNIYVPGVDNQRLVQMLSEYECCISAGSACHSGDSSPSHVLKAMGMTDERSNSSIRISLGRDNYDAQIDRFEEIFNFLIKAMRS